MVLLQLQGGRCIGSLGAAKGCWTHLWNTLSIFYIYANMPGNAVLATAITFASIAKLA